MCINEEIKPFEPNEWSKLALKLMDNNIEPFQLLDLNEDIIEKLNFINVIYIMKSKKNMVKCILMS